MPEAALWLVELIVIYLYGRLLYSLFKRLTKEPPR